MQTQILEDIRKAEEGAKALAASTRDEVRQVMARARDAADKQADDARTRAEAEAAELIKKETARAEEQAATVQEDGKKRLETIRQAASGKVDDAVALASKKLLV